MTRLALSLVFAALVTPAAVAQSAAPLDLQIAEDEQLLQAAKVGVTPQALLEYLRQQTVKADERQQFALLIKKLDDRSYQKREKAMVEVIGVGPKALPVLRRGLQGATLEMRLRLERCIQALEKDSAAQTAGAVVRLIKVRRPAGACAVLFSYVASAPDENVEEEVIDALASLGVRDSTVDPLFEAALSDPLPAKRGAGALLLGRAGSRHQRALVHLLLDDPHPTVRLRAAQGLLLGRDRSAIPALIALLAKAPLAVAEQAEDTLVELAGKTAPSASLGDDGDARQKCYQAWTTWWQTNQTKIAPARANLESLSRDNPTARVREVAKSFMVGVFKFDKGLIRKTTDLPFFIGGGLGERIYDREAWDMLFGEVPVEQRMKEVKFIVLKVMAAEEYAKTAPREDTEVLKSFGKQPIRVVIGNLHENGQRREQFSLFVRVTGTRARVVGIGAPQPDKRQQASQAASGRARYSLASGIRHNGTWGGS
jgi:HEAT repeat protein